MRGRKVGARANESWHRNWRPLATLGNDVARSGRALLLKLSLSYAWPCRGGSGGARVLRHVALCTSALLPSSAASSYRLNGVSDQRAEKLNVVGEIKRRVIRRHVSSSWLE